MVGSDGSAAGIGAGRIGSVADGAASRETRWTIHGERVLDDSRKLVFSIADVELPDGTRFEQYVLRAPSAAVVVTVDDEQRVLMMWRHRFIIDRWVWELPGGWVDPGEDPLTTAAREVEEETGWRPGPLEHLVTFQSMVGTADAANIVYLARGAVCTGERPDVNEAQEVAWLPLASVPEKIRSGEIVGSASVTGLLFACAEVGILIRVP